ncbi:hypothetical protein E2C01_090888 [Portunus trituberculatus]|uniref:Uncharacterized protein n=1 Tax=Portunus trituberculatus TaxID=210409 RepID=A0A5B7JRK3_PORTR|nr:hypothetical protein [Portunus trituberculatus]
MVQYEQNLLEGRKGVRGRRKREKGGSEAGRGQAAEERRVQAIIKDDYTDHSLFTAIRGAGEKTKSWCQFSRATTQMVSLLLYRAQRGPSDGAPFDNP